MFGCLLLVLIQNGIAGAAPTLRVGVFEFPPLSYNTPPRGLAVDLLADIARRHGWRLEYTALSLAACLDKLSRGDLDIVPGLVRSPDREQRMDFSREWVIMDWVQVFSPEMSDIESVQDLQGKTVARLKGSYSGSRLPAVLKEFGITCTFLDLEGIADMETAISDGRADALVGSRFLSYDRGMRSTAPTAVTFAPSKERFALRKGLPQHIRETLDAELTSLKADPSSVYHHLRKKHLTPTGWALSPKTKVGLWCTGLSLLLSMGANLWLRRRLLRKTRTLRSLLTRVRQKERRNRRLFKHSRDAIVVFDRTGRIVRANPRACEQLGYSRKELLSLAIPNLLEPQRAWRALRRAWESPQKRQEILCRDKHGRIFPAEARIAFFTEGGHSMALAHVRDITVQKRLQAGMRQSRNAAQAANRTKDEFLINMSHELRTPLNGMLGCLRMLETSALNEEQRHYVHMASRSGWGLLDILEDLLVMAQIDSHGITSNDKPFSPRELTEKTCNTFAPRAKEKGLALRAAVSESTPDTLSGDARRVRQLLFNLLGNALRFTEKGYIEVEVFLLPVRHPGENDLLAVSVTDTGIGIAEDRLDSVLEPFAQADGSLTRRRGGLGLGLGIVSRLVRTLGGTLSLDSAEGQGTTILFTIPVTRPKQKDATAETASDTPLKAGLSILVVEDEPVNRLLLTRQLQKLGHQTAGATNGEEALEHLLRESFDCVLMDVQMPVMDGLTATRRIRTSPNLPQSIPIIAVTAHALDEDRARCLEAGMDDFITKPVIPSTLKEKLARVTPPALAAPLPDTAGLAQEAGP